jgi:hypothetical protein
MMIITGTLVKIFMAAYLRGRNDNGLPVLILDSKF